MGSSHSAPRRTNSIRRLSSNRQLNRHNSNNNSSRNVASGDGAAESSNTTDTAATRTAITDSGQTPPVSDGSARLVPHSQHYDGMAMMPSLQEEASEETTTKTRRHKRKKKPAHDDPPSLLQESESSVRNEDAEIAQQIGEDATGGAGEETKQAAATTTVVEETGGPSYSYGGSDEDYSEFVDAVGFRSTNGDWEGGGFDNDNIVQSNGGGSSSPTVQPVYCEEGTQASWGPPVYTPVITATVNPSYDHNNYTGVAGSYYGYNPPQSVGGEYYYGSNGDGGIDHMTPTAGPAPDFFPQGSRHCEWMGRSLETLVLGYASVAPILCLPEDEEGGCDEDTVHMWGATRRRSTISTLGSDTYGRRSSLGSLAGTGRRGSLVGNSSRMHGGTLANYYNRRTGRRGSNNSNTGRRRSSTGASRRGSASHGPSYHRRRLSMSRSNSADSDEVRAGGPGRGEGPNIALSLLARETTGRLTTRNATPISNRLRSMGGQALFNCLDRPAAGMCSEVGFLSEVIDSGDWAETQTVISRISPRLIGDPTAMLHPGMDRSAAVEDPNLPPTASRFYAGGGRLGLERDAFVLAGGVDVLIRVFREPSFVGAEMAQTYDARDLSEELVSNRLAPCWNEALACLRELVYAIPSLVDNEVIFDQGEFLPFLFTLLSHESCFDGAAALIEEILSLQSHSPPPLEDDDMISGGGTPTVRVAPPTTFFLGNVPDLYKLWGGFNCRQLAHFCRILALLVFEPEDRQLLESPAVLKSIELLQLRRNRAARAGRDSTVDMNQSILLGDAVLVERFLQLLSVMNFAPPLRRSSTFHVMAHFPYIADTLVMLGLYEFDNWQDITRLEGLARTLVHDNNAIRGDRNRVDDAAIAGGNTSRGDPGDTRNVTRLSDLGAVAEMLENLLSTLMENPGTPNNQLTQIIHVITAAQQAGVVVGRPRQNRSRRRDQSHRGDDQDGSTARATPAGIEEFTSAAGILSDQVLARLYTSTAEEDDGTGYDSRDLTRAESNNGRDTFTGHPAGSMRSRINTPKDAANILQFNAFLLGPYQVEVLFVLCTLLGGRRKIDAQELLKRHGVISILDDMFERLPWDSLSPSRQSVARDSEDRGGAFNESDEQPTGIHGPGCECTPESALCVQFLRLLHNFCDRDCDNYDGRRLLLSKDERRCIFENPIATEYDMSQLSPGLLSKIIIAFIGESDESPYRFWLASCVESYLRGSSPPEQVFVARTGLLEHLIDDITSQRLHCAGSLQTSFDLLGELCKGNTEVLRRLVRNLDEERFRKLMSVAAANLVDSNVFIRSVILSLERISSSNGLLPLHLDSEMFSSSRGKWRSANGVFSRSYLTHSWWDTCAVNMPSVDSTETNDESNDSERQCDIVRPSDWFPTIGSIEACKMEPPETIETQSVGLHDGVGHFGWIFTPEGDSLSPATHAPNTVERLSWFLAANQTRLLRDLLGVVDLRNINHENICCLNTAVVIAIFAHRRRQLHVLLQDLKRMNAEEREHKRRAVNAAAAAKEDDVIDRAFVQAMKYMALDLENPPARYARRASLTRRSSLSFTANSGTELGDRNDVMRNFREVLWFWMEYYTHRGRDRLSLEFSSHLRFQEWMEVVSLLGADDGSPTSLVPSPLPLPRSPYQRAA